MATLTIELPQDVAESLTRQAGALLLNRRSYVRAVLATVAAQPKPALRRHLAGTTPAPNSKEPLENAAARGAA